MGWGMGCGMGGELTEGDLDVIGAFIAVNLDLGDPEVNSDRGDVLGHEALLAEPLDQAALPRPAAGGADTDARWVRVWP